MNVNGTNRKDIDVSALIESNKYDIVDLQNGSNHWFNCTYLKLIEVKGGRDYIWFKYEYYTINFYVDEIGYRYRVYIHQESK